MYNSGFSRCLKSEQKNGVRKLYLKAKPLKLSALCSWLASALILWCAFAAKFLELKLTKHKAKIRNMNNV